MDEGVEGGEIESYLCPFLIVSKQNVANVPFDPCSRGKEM